MAREHMKMNTSYVSCGVLELGSLRRTPEKNAYELANRLYHPANGQPEAFVMMSDQASKGNRTAVLAEFMASSELAEVRCAGPAINPKSGNAIVMYILTLNHDNFRRWYVGEGINRLKKSHAGIPGGVCNE
jgi:hypothetical protein